MGRPKGSKNKKKFYKDKEQIKEIFTELKPFFDIKNGEQSGMKEMTRCFDSLNLTERKVFNRNLRYNAKFSYLDQLSELLVACFFNCKNPFQYYHSKVRKTLEGCGKSTLNNFLNNDYIDWRAVCDRFFKRIAEDFQTISQIEEQDEEEARRLKGESAPSVKPQRYRVGIVDDTDDKHFGKKFELGGKIFSHTEKKMILGHKILLFTINDGISTLIKDLAIVGEKGSDGNQCLTQEEIEERYTKEREPDCPGEERAQEQMKSKMDISKEMLQRAVEQGEHLDYFLGDSWFGCPSLALYVLELNAGIHFLGMTKKNRTQYIIKNGDEEERICATGLIQKFEKTEHNKYDRSLKYHHIDVDAFIEDKEKNLSL